MGNVLAPATLSEGERVLDIGCGCGLDALLAALLVGPGGHVTGLDLSPAMVEQAQRSADEAGIRNVRFLTQNAAEWDCPKECFDVVLSNGVFNLIAEKEACLRAVWRLLKPGGRLVVADQMRVPQLTMGAKANAPLPSSWAL